MDYDRDAMDYHAKVRPGKLEVVATKPLLTQRDLSMAYTPGVADPCRKGSLPCPLPRRVWPTRFRPDTKVFSSHRQNSHKQPLTCGCRGSTAFAAGLCGLVP